MSATKQDLLSLKEENMKMKDNFKNFLQKYKTNKKYVPKQKVMEFMEEQDSLMDNLNLQIDNILVKNEKSYQKPTKMLPKKRKIPEILPFVGNKISPKRPRMEFVIVKNSLENIINNPGLQHLAENIFSYLNYKDLESCQHINTSSKLILANPRFWLNRFIQKGMSKKNQIDWIKAFQLIQNEDLKRKALLYLKNILQKGRKLVDIPCYILDSSILLRKKRSTYNSIKNDRLEALYYRYNAVNFGGSIPGAIQILPADNEIKKNPRSFKSIYWMARIMCLAAKRGHFDVIQSLSSIMDNPNYPLIIDFNHPLTINPIFPHGNSETPIGNASKNGHLRIVKFLVSQSGNLEHGEIIKSAILAKAHGQNHIYDYLRSIHG